MKTVLITGASGFMGQNIAEYLSTFDTYKLYGVTYNHNPITNINNKFEKVYTANLTKQSGVDHCFSDTKYDIVIHAAAVTSGAKDIIETPHIHVTDNVIMNSLLLRKCYEMNVGHFIFLSCGVMYQSGEEPKKESDFKETDDIYPTYFGAGWMKVYTEKQMEFYSRLNRTIHTAIRHSNTYGPYDKYDLEHSHVFGATIRKVVESTDNIEVWGTGEETARDLVYVKDIAELIHNVIQKQDVSYALVNAGIGKAITVKDLVEKIIKIYGKDITIKYNVDKPIIPTKLSLDSSLAYELFGWKPRTTIDEGIEKTLEWYKNNYKE